MSDPTDDAPPAPAVPISHTTPEADEAGEQGDSVEFVSTGWIRFVFAGHGRVRLRPPRMGQLREIMEAQEASLDVIQEAADQGRIRGAELQALANEDEKNPDIDAAERERRYIAYRKENREIGRKITEVRQRQQTQLWTLIHERLGVSGESWPTGDDMPVWLLDGALLPAAIAHWQTVPLAPGSAPAT